jgi:hypothetical protein
MLVQYDLLQTLIALLQEPSVVRMSTPRNTLRNLNRPMHSCLLTMSNVNCPA